MNTHVRWFLRRAAAVLASALLAAVALGAESPHPTAEADTMVVVGHHEVAGQESRSAPPGAVLQKILRGTPFVLIRRGATSSSDLYADGFKRGDITVTVDGERHTTACPNRMDTRVGQINLLDIERVDLLRTGGALQAGLGGTVTYRRRLPGRDVKIYGRLMGSLGHADAGDASVAIEGRRLRLTGRYRAQTAWTDADDKTFEDRYGYRDAPTGTVGEVQVVGAWDTGHAVGAFEVSRDLLFPYLLMDERTNDHYEASASYRQHRLYLNYNDHFMDNALRTSGVMTDMWTRATNLMLGVTGDFYEVYARNWDADNAITPLTNPAMGTVNRMLPDVWRFYASLQHTVGDPRGVTLTGRLGVASTRAGDTSRADWYTLVHAGAETETWSLPFGATLGYTLPLSSETVLGLSGEVSSDAPGVEELYIAVDKPGDKPTWLGNPELRDPVRATLRAVLQHEVLRCELFGTRVWNYPYLERRMVAGDPYQTYGGVGALLAGVNLGVDWDHVAGSLSWNWGEKTRDNGPLAEILPLTFTVEGRSPAVGPARAWLAWQASASQDRVDVTLQETGTPGWHRIDLGVDLVGDHWTVAVAAENLFDELYAQHLSYLRNPFAAGEKVREPGRTIRATATFHY